MIQCLMGRVLLLSRKICFVNENLLKRMLEDESKENRCLRMSH